MISRRRVGVAYRPGAVHPSDSASSPVGAMLAGTLPSGSSFASNDESIESTTMNARIAGSNPVASSTPSPEAAA